MIVGRDTENLSETGVTKAAVETIAENTSDGAHCTAPLSLPSADRQWAFCISPSIPWIPWWDTKMTNICILDGVRQSWTMSSNYIPARISAWLMILASACERMNWKNAEKIYKRDRYCHASPNFCADRSSYGRGAGSTACRRCRVFRQSRKETNDRR